jgi:hypothetical protein
MRVDPGEIETSVRSLKEFHAAVRYGMCVIEDQPPKRFTEPVSVSMKNAKRLSLITGVNTSLKSPLKHAERDAREMHALMHRMRFDDSVLLLGEEAAAPAIMDRLQNLAADLGPDGLLLFYFSGHAVLDQSGHYLMAFGSDGEGEPLAVHDILKSMDKAGSFGRAIVTDACRTQGSVPRCDAAMPNAAAADGDDASQADLNTLYEGAYRNLAGSSESSAYGQALFNSCEDQKQAVELNQIGHGLFTRSLLDSWRASLDAGEPIWFDWTLRDAVVARMKEIAAANGFDPEKQWPLFQESRPLPLSLDGILLSKKMAASASPSTKSTGNDSCGACGKRFLTNLDRTGTCQADDCGRPICNHCWLALDTRFCKDHHTN